jgi:hypothetical protein
VKLVKEIGIETPIVASHILDPYIILRVEGAQNIVLLHSPDVNTLQTVPVTLSKENGAVTACCLFYDDFGTFSEATKDGSSPAVAEPAVTNNHTAPIANGQNGDEDEEDLLLYSSSRPVAQPKPVEPVKPKQKPAHVRQYYCALSRENGRFEVRYKC